RRGWRCALVVPEAGLEPARLAAGDFESPASTDFATPAVSCAGRTEGRDYARRTRTGTRQKEALPQSSQEISRMPRYQTLEDVIGKTPLVQLQRLPGLDNEQRGNVILAKLEGNNPAGSVKDRPAISMIRRAQERGEIKPGDTLIEATSGNTGIALAMAAAI